ncbi:MAG: MerR family transcriptional regulator [Flavobacteriales bacterium]|nr:MerR family transcriptional regulator [Flavobacteriales bacterium]
MPWKERPVEKLYFSIGEVAEELGVANSSIRYWEKEFGMSAARRTGKGDRQYTRKEIEQFRSIQRLVKEKGFTLHGAKVQLRNPDPEPTAPVDLEQLCARLLKVRRELAELRRNIITAG